MPRLCMAWTAPDLCTGPALLRKHVSKQVRLIAKSPSHITHVTSQDLLRKHEIEDPVIDLSRRIRSRIDKTRTGPVAKLQPARVHKRWSFLLHQSTLTPAPHEHPTLCPETVVATGFPGLCELPPGTRMVACPTCGIHFPSLKTMRQHMTLTHLKHNPDVPVPARRTQQQMRQDFMQHATSGLPTCTHCQWEFASWPAFFQHFEHARCPVLHKTCVAPVPAQSPETAANSDAPQKPAPARMNSSTRMKPLFPNSKFHVA